MPLCGTTDEGNKSYIRADSHAAIAAPSENENDGYFRGGKHKFVVKVIAGNKRTEAAASVSLKAVPG
jgi:hypothetical protein